MMETIIPFRCFIFVANILYKHKFGDLLSIIVCWLITLFYSWAIFGLGYLIQKQPSCKKKVCGPQEGRAVVKKDVKSKVAAKKWL